MTRPCSRFVARIACSLGLLAWLAAPVLPAAAEGPSLLVPAGRDSAGADTIRETQPAPLLVPGRPLPGDAAKNKSRAERAREKFELGVAFERDGKPAAAMAAYQAATRLDPSIPEARFRMGRLFLTVDQVAAAAGCFAAEVKRHPAHTEAGRELGIALTRLGEYPRAIVQLELLTRRNPADHESWRALGAAYLKAGREKDAESAMRHAVRLKPGRADYHRDLGVVLAAEGRGGAAREEYARARQLDPRDATTWLDLGNLERRERRLEPALEAYRRAEARDSSLVLAVRGQTETLLDLGREAEAGEVLRRWLRANPQDPQARLEAARLFAGIGRTDIALEVAREGVRTAPRSGEARLTLGMALDWGGDARGGLAEMRRAEELFPDSAGRARARAVIASVRERAPDSLRAFYAADSAAHDPTRAGR